MKKNIFDCHYGIADKKRLPSFGNVKPEKGAVPDAVLGKVVGSFPWKISVDHPDLFQGEGNATTSFKTNGNCGGKDGEGFE